MSLSGQGIPSKRGHNEEGPHPSAHQPDFFGQQDRKESLAGMTRHMGWLIPDINPFFL